MKPLQFLKETRNELKHVIWPTRFRAITYTIIIIVFSLAVGYLLGGFDQLFRVILRSVVIK
ncbi:MAG TPA: preprotein translocase subunit SecE [Candidatus Paceibacterota bacterium]|nr:preprotein translocase subunit SecE [Candidatus Paceibacterota bacterium]